MSRAGREPGYKKTNQDNCFAFEKYIAEDQSLFGAMDGHGPNGAPRCAAAAPPHPPWAGSRLQAPPAGAARPRHTYTAARSARRSPPMVRLQGTTCRAL
jgi:hypothetical protein